ncbi:DUF6624 domain-containing protein [Streptomyces lasiicapitis]|uniref:Uncharacterized protein n=1 Tax=Streptomyces lasiicapitis TaxID=1923961 RepID=A0ABQ2MP93_9ACTN|nr:DUF6624 domain-containing protein [Streptomyces lasiicapitis]GGO55285.1 hypothetical protein GCM10012286_67030 [Streptomyces lasiicapitis]
MAPRRPDLATELLARMAEDQRMRLLPKADQPPDHLARWRAVDADNTDALRRVVDAHGWPGFALVGKEAAHAAWLLAQHAGEDPEFQHRALGLLAAAVEVGDADPADLAFLVDRCRVHDGLPQVYGTQYIRDADGLRMQPVEDPDHLDERRAAAGLEPHAENDARMRALYEEA